MEHTQFSARLREVPEAAGGEGGRFKTEICVHLQLIHVAVQQKPTRLVTLLSFN